ncbi:MAG: hypothetical protein HC933_05525 [Pleurocapsa sp. SU_196_0]|nr:hypothetical protein [Pleurocapsa sp. SU_196_0]
MFVNGEFFNWGHGTVKLNDLTLIDFDEISDWGYEVERKLRYGKGYKPRGFTTTQYKAEGPSIKLTQEQMNIILEIPEVRQKGILNVQFTVTVVLDKGNGEVYEGSLGQCMLNKVSLDGFKQGGDAIMRTLKFFTFGELIENGVSPFGDA